MMKLIAFLVTLILLTSTIYAADLDRYLREFGKDMQSDAEDYLRPLATSFGTNLNSGLYNTADVLKPSIIRPIRFGFNIHAMLAFVPDSDKTFEGSQGESATVFGDKGTQPYPDGLDLSVVPLFVPQFRFGLPKGNEVMIRYLPPIDIGDFGTVDFWGVGFKHSIDQYIPLFPIHLAVQGAYQSFEVGDLVSISSLAVNAQASKRLLMLTLYGGLGWEDTKLTAEYQPVGEIDEKVKFDIKGDNNVRLTAGFRWAIIPFIHLNADYTISNYQALTLGIGMQL